MTTTTKPLSVEDVRALLVRAVEEKGADYVYEKVPGFWSDGTPMDDVTCNYFHDGKPSCIVGHVFSYCGIERVEREGDNARTMAVELGIGDALIGEALDRAQAAQDAGKTWGEALAEFDRAVAELSA